MGSRALTEHFPNQFATAVSLLVKLRHSLAGMLTKLLNDFLLERLSFRVATTSLVHSASSKAFTVVTESWKDRASTISSIT